MPRVILTFKILNIQAKEEEWQQSFTLACQLTKGLEWVLVHLKAWLLALSMVVAQANSLNIWKRSRIWRLGE